MMKFEILFLLIIGLGSISGRVPHCVPCTEPFRYNDYYRACSKLLWSRGYRAVYEKPLQISVIDFQKEEILRKDTFCIPCGKRPWNFEAVCHEFNRKFQESERERNLYACKEDNLEVFFEGRCQNLLEQGTCPENQWLVIKDKKTGPECECNKCFDPKSLSVNFYGSCLDLNRRSGYECRNDTKLVIHHDGTANCMCSHDEKVQLPYRKCIETRQRTRECAPNWVLEKTLDGNPVCVHNVCSDNELYLNNQCWPRTSYCKTERHSCESNLYKRNAKASFCVPPHPPAFQGPYNDDCILNCPLGLRRIKGECPRITAREKLSFL